MAGLLVSAADWPRSGPNVYRNPSVEINLKLL